MEKRRNCSLGAISPLFLNIFYLLLDFHVYAGTRFSLRDKRLFEISQVEIMGVNCNLDTLKQSTMICNHVKMYHHPHRLIILCCLSVETLDS